MAKRKRAPLPPAAAAGPPASSPSKSAPSAAASASPSLPTPDPAAVRLQVVAGSYEKILHGFVVTVPTAAPSASDADSLDLAATFADTFLFTAHTSPVRVLAVSPPTGTSAKRILASASADERINLYTLSSVLPPTPSAVSTSLKNKHLGTLHHHSNTPTTLLFTPTRSKLFTAAEDGTIHILRCRDWSPLTVLKAPKPKPKPVNYSKDYGDGYGPRISTFGNDAGLGGINAIALHPSQKILLSVSQGERTVRSWNLMTGRKAGALTLDVPKRFGSQPLRVEWGREGLEYAVAFERGVVVYGMDSQVRSRIQTKPLSKVHQMRYVAVPKGIFGQLQQGEKAEKAGDGQKNDAPEKSEHASDEVLAISTEDGRILFYSTAPATADDPDTPTLLGTLGGRALGMPGRVKDFSLLSVTNPASPSKSTTLVITAGSDGVVRVWDLCGAGSGIEIEADEEEKEEEGQSRAKKAKTSNGQEDSKVTSERKGEEEEKRDGTKQVGRLVGIYETGRRITCIATLEMGVGEDAEDAAAEEEKQKSDDDNSSDEESD